MKTTSKLLISSLVLAGFMGATVAQAADPAPADLQRVVDEAYAKYKDLKDGANADYIPILTTVPSELYGVVIVTRDGKVYSAGDTDYEFSIQSVSKPFTAGLIMAAWRSIRSWRWRSIPAARSTRWSTRVPLRPSAWSRRTVRKSAGRRCPATSTTSRDAS